MEIEMSVISCAKCLATFAIPAAMDKRFRESHSSFYCPNGHVQFYPALTDLDLANRKVKSLELEVESLNAVIEKKSRASKKHPR